MYKYENIIKRLLNDRPYKIKGEEISSCCPFHKEMHPSFSINAENGAYYCHACEAQGSITNFVANMCGISTKEAWKEIQEETNTNWTYNSNFLNNKYLPYTLEDYAQEKQIDIKNLEYWGIKNASDGKSIIIPYYDIDGKYIGARHRNNPASDVRFWWEEGTITNLYGLWTLNELENDYIVLVEGESDCHAMWLYQIQTIGVPGAKQFKKSYATLFERFDKIYIHNEKDKGSENFIKKICEALPYEKLYSINSKAIDNDCKDPSDLHIKGLLDKGKLLATAEKIDKDYYDIINKKDLKEEKNRSRSTNQDEEVQKHVKVAEEVMKKIEIRCCKGIFYTYDNGVYRDNLQLIEEIILNTDNNLKKSQRAEVLDYIRIKQGKNEIEVDENYINFKNGMYDLRNNKLIPHNPSIFTTCQININYIEDEKIVPNEHMEQFLNDITCNNINRKVALLQIIGYCMSFRVDLQKGFIFYGPSSKNGKSTVISIINELIGKDNICHITIHQLLKRFVISELTNKLLNTETEMATDILSNLEVFKKIVTGDEISVEKKYQDRYIIKPFAKFIFGTNHLPEIEKAGEDYFRRLNILLFEKQFSREEEVNFDKSKLLTQEALNYLGNIALREYIKIIPTHILANEEESENIIANYKYANDSIKNFLEDEREIDRIFISGNEVPKAFMYQSYTLWCTDNNYIPRTKKDVFNELLTRGEYSICKKNGYEFVRNTTKKSWREIAKEAEMNTF